MCHSGLVVDRRIGLNQGFRCAIEPIVKAGGRLYGIRFSHRHSSSEPSEEDSRDRFQHVRRSRLRCQRLSAHASAHTRAHRRQGRLPAESCVSSTRVASMCSELSTILFVAGRAGLGLYIPARFWISGTAGPTRRRLWPGMGSVLEGTGRSWFLIHTLGSLLDAYSDSHWSRPNHPTATFYSRFNRNPYYSTNDQWSQRDPEPRWRSSESA